MNIPHYPSQSIPLDLMQSKENEVDFSFELWVRIYTSNLQSKIGQRISFLLENNRLQDAREIIE